MTDEEFRIFFIYIYQSRIYRVDYSRVNEFGQGGEEEVEEKKEALKKIESKKNTVEGPGAEGDGKIDGKEGKAKGKGSGTTATSGRNQESSGDVRKR